MKTYKRLLFVPLFILGLVLLSSCSIPSLSDILNNIVTIEEPSDNQNQSKNMDDITNIEKNDLSAKPQNITVSLKSPKPGQHNNQVEHVNASTSYVPAQQSPTQQPTPNTTPSPNSTPPNHSGDFTIMLNKCFDLNTGSDIACSDPNADFRYTYIDGQGASIIPLNTLECSVSMQDEPGRSDCESATYYGLTLQLYLPTENSRGQYYCFSNEYQGDTYYGWFQPVYFNGGGITFNAHTFSNSMLLNIGNAVLAPNPFFLNYGENQTLLVEKCFDFIDGEKSACNGIEADFKLIQGSQKLELNTLNSTQFAVLTSSTPSKQTCENAQLMTGVAFLPNLPPS